MLLLKLSLRHTVTIFVASLMDSGFFVLTHYDSWPTLQTQKQELIF